MPAVGFVRDVHDGAETAQHALGMIAGGLGLDDLGDAVDAQARQQHGRLDLGRGHGQAIGDGLEIAAPEGQGKPALVATHIGDAHLRERIEHPAHRPLDQRMVAREGGRQRKGGRRAHDQTDAGAGIAAVDDRIRLGQAAPAVDDPGAVLLADIGAEGDHGIPGGQDVVAFEQAFDARFAFGQGAENHRAVRDGLVAGRADGAFQRAGRPGGQD